MVWAVPLYLSLILFQRPDVDHNPAARAQHSSQLLKSPDSTRVRAEVVQDADWYHSVETRTPVAKDEMKIRSYMYMHYCRLIGHCYNVYDRHDARVLFPRAKDDWKNYKCQLEMNGISMMDWEKPDVKENSWLPKATRLLLHGLSMNEREIAWTLILPCINWWVVWYNQNVYSLKCI